MDGRKEGMKDNRLALPWSIPPDRGCLGVRRGPPPTQRGSRRWWASTWSPPGAPPGDSWTRGTEPEQHCCTCWPSPPSSSLTTTTIKEAKTGNAGKWNAKQRPLSGNGSKVASESNPHLHALQTPNANWLTDAARAFCSGCCFMQQERHHAAIISNPNRLTKQKQSQLSALSCRIKQNNYRITIRDSREGAKRQQPS